jgi:4-hydroxybenzoyl-CoA reductase subunit beta
MTLADFRLTQPASVEDAVAACCQSPDSRYIGGGTDLLVNMRRGIAGPRVLVDLSGIDGVR